MSKKVLILVLSMDQGYYRDLAYASKATWDSVEVENVEVVYYFGDEGMASKMEYDPKRRNLFTGTGEGLTVIGYKNIVAFEWALENREFDYIIRANASTYVNKKLVAEYVQGLSEKDLYMGVGAPYTYVETKFLFAWGPHYCLSRDVVQKIVENKGLWNHLLMDDVSLGLLMTVLHIPINNGGTMATIDIRRGSEPPAMFLTCYNNAPDAGGVITDLSELNKWKLPMIRVKQDFDRTQDVRLMKELFKALDK